MPVDAEVTPVPAQMDVAREFGAADFPEFGIDVLAGAGVCWKSSSRTWVPATVMAKLWAPSVKS